MLAAIWGSKVGAWDIDLTGRSTRRTKTGASGIRNCDAKPIQSPPTAGRFHLREVLRATRGCQEVVAQGPGGLYRCTLPRRSGPFLARLGEPPAGGALQESRHSCLSVEGSWLRRVRRQMTTFSFAP